MLGSVVEDDACCRGISLNETAAVLSGKDPFGMNDNNDNYEDRSSDGDGPEEKADESKPSNAECISQQNRKKKASKGTESVENNTEERETKNEGQTSLGGI